MGVPVFLSEAALDLGDGWLLAKNGLFVPFYVDGAPWFEPIAANGTSCKNRTKIPVRMLSSAVESHLPQWR